MGVKHAPVLRHKGKRQPLHRTLRKARRRAHADHHAFRLVRGQRGENCVHLGPIPNQPRAAFLFQRKAVKDVSVYETIEKVKKYFKRNIDGKINIKVIKDNDVIIKTNAGLILQIVVNLLDNAIYWVNTNESKDKEIVFKLDSINRTVTIADNGPGIQDEIVPLVFSEFFTRKLDGRGLGLYIVKEILLRIDGEISVVEDDRKKLLSGANLIIKFNLE